MSKDDFWKTMAEIDDILDDKKENTEKVETYKDFCEYSNNRYVFTNDARVQFLTNQDKAFCILFGTFGALTAANFSEYFAQIHDKEFNKRENPSLWSIAKFLEHPKTYPDKVKGGLSHRAEYGHDVFNLEEVYECIKVDGKGDLWKGTKAYIKHVILADPLSKQGIPIPGTSIFRKSVVEIAKNEQDFYKSVLTYKHKDLVGCLLVEALVRLYNTYYKFDEDMYRYHEMHFYSQFINFAMGYFLFIPSTVNWTSFIRMTKSFNNIRKLSRKLNDGWIKEADEIINKYKK